MAKLTGDNSRFDSENNEWETPDEIFIPLNNEFKFTIDLAASKHNKKCPIFFSKEQNTLVQDWKGIGWLNPPFGEVGGNQLKRFIEKAYNESKKHNSTIVMLVPSRTNTNWWHDYCMKGEVRFIRGRPAFKGCKYGLMQPLAIVIFWGAGCASHSSQQSERERVLETINWHIATAKQELETGYERDGGKWVGSNRTDYPRGKLDALEKLKKELRNKGG